MKHSILITTLLLLLTATKIMAASDGADATATEAAASNWEPVPVWPFAYQDFTDANIYVGEKKVKAKANIHLKNSNLWFISSKDNKTKLEASSVSKVEFKNGDIYYDINGHLAKVVREDTINGDVRRLFQKRIIDMEQFNDLSRQYNQQGGSNFGVVLDTFTSAVADNNGQTSLDQHPLPLQDLFFMEMNGEKFQMTESNILRHLSNKNEKNAYRAYTRKAEILSGNLSSMMNVYTTFFLK